MPATLTSAYRATDYVAFSEKRAFSIRVGQHSLLIDRLLAKMKTRSGSFITAWNPYSKSQSAGANASRERKLKAILAPAVSRFSREKVAGKLENGLQNLVF
jgi:hypothetical protein